MYSWIASIKASFQMFFGTPQKEERVITEPVSPIPRSPKKTEVVQVQLPPMRQKMKTSTAVVVMERRRKQNGKSAVNVLPVTQKKFVPLAHKDMYVHLHIGEFVPVGSDERLVCCIKEILCCFRDTQAINGELIRFKSLRKKVLENDFFESDFIDAFRWLSKSGLILRNPKCRKKRLVSLGVKSKNQEAQKFFDTILKSFRNAGTAVSR